MRGFALLSLLILLGAAAPAWAETQLILKDGRVLEGTACYRDGGNYILKLENGDEIAMPEELVEAVGLSGKEDPAEAERDEEDEERLPGFRYTESETVAGEPPRLADRRESLEALGPPARFPRDIVDSRWKPESDWDMDPANNDFSPSKWANSPVDPSWKPRSAWDDKKDVLESSRSSWPKNVLDSAWTPTNGFKN